MSLVWTNALLLDTCERTLHVCQCAHTFESTRMVHLCQFLFIEQSRFKISPTYGRNILAAKRINPLCACLCAASCVACACHAPPEPLLQQHVHCSIRSTEAAGLVHVEPPGGLRHATAHFWQTLDSVHIQTLLCFCILISSRKSKSLVCVPKRSTTE